MQVLLFTLVKILCNQWLHVMRNLLLILTRFYYMINFWIMSRKRVGNSDGPIKTGGREDGRFKCARGKSDLGYRW